MITGAVSSNFEAIVPLSIAGVGTSTRTIEAVIDTGFSGHLTLPSDVVSELQLTWVCREPGELADGSVVDFDVYRANIIWNGKPRHIEVNAIEVQPLVGMALLEHHSLYIEVSSGGGVVITPAR